MFEEEVNHVISSIEWVSNYGHHFLPLYHFDLKTGNWTFRYPSESELLVLHNIDRKVDVGHNSFDLSNLLERVVTKHVVTQETEAKIIWRIMIDVYVNTSLSTLISATLIVFQYMNFSICQWWRLTKWYLPHRTTLSFIISKFAAF